MLLHQLAAIMADDEEAIAALFAGMFGLFMILFVIIIIAAFVLMIVAEWKLFEKAGKPGWASIIPFYNTWVMFEIVYGEGWKSLLIFIPTVGSFIPLIAFFRLAQVFGKSTLMGVLCALFSPIVIAMLAFGDAQYQGPVDSFL